MGLVRGSDRDPGRLLGWAVTLPADWQLRVPEGISDASAEGLRAQIERLDSVGVERALVWHIPSVVEAALPHLAAGLGLDKLNFVSTPPRDFLGVAIALMRRRGTPAALEDALVALGYALVDIELREDTSIALDGSWHLSGEPYRLGADSHWATFWLYVAAPAGLTTAALLALWDVVDLMRPKRSPCVLIIETTTGPRVYRARSEIT